MKTRTIRTANGGFRCLFIVDKPEDCLDFKSKSPHVEIHGTKGHHVIVYGKGLRDDKTLGTYELVQNEDIREDNNILNDMKEFLTDIHNKHYFLEYKCIKNSLPGKKNHLIQEQRTSIGAFFAANHITLEDAVDLYRTCPDFEYDKTQKHLEFIYSKDFKHPKCETLRKNFNWTNKKCEGYLRNKGKGTQYKQKKHRNRVETDLTKRSTEDIFHRENTKMGIPITHLSETPIFTVGGYVFYVIPLQPVIEEIPKKRGPPQKETKKVQFLWPHGRIWLRTNSIYYNGDRCNNNRY